MATATSALDSILRLNVFGQMSSFPTSGSWNVGDVIKNAAIGTGGPIGWVCTVAGSTGGTWAPITNPTSATGVTAIAAAGTIGPSSNIVDVGTGGFAITLSAPVALDNNAVVRIVNDTASPVTLTPVSGVTLYAGSAVVLANTSAQIQVNTLNYYRIA